MKQYNSPSSCKAGPQQLTLESPRLGFTSSIYDQKAGLTNDFGQNVINKQQNNGSVSASAASYNIKQSDFRSLALAISCCLNNQSKMAEAIGEIGLYLNDLTENGNANSGDNLRKQLVLQHSSSMNHNLNQSRDRTSKESSIQGVILKLDTLKKDIAHKVSDFESQLQGFDIRDVLHTKNVQYSIEEQPYYLPSKYKLTSENEVKTNKQSRDETEIMQYGLNYFPKRVNTVSSDLHNGLPESLNEISNTGKMVIDTFASTESSRFLQAKKTSPSNGAAKSERTFEKKGGVNLHIAGDSSTSRDQVVLKTQETPKNVHGGKSPSSTGLRLAKSKEIAPSNTKIIYETIQGHLNQKKQQKQAQVASFTKTEIKSNTIQQTKLSRRSNAIDHRRIDEAGPMGGILRNSNFPREETLENGQRKNCIKPPLNSIPQKQVVDDSLRDPTIDQTMQGDNSHYVPSDNNTQNFTQEERLQSSETNRVYPGYEMTGEVMQEHTQSFLRNIANKEKTLIKALLKERVGDETNVYSPRGDLGKLNQRKFLINARWWRAWKEFVNFDADDGTLAKSSFFEMGLYPRPGQINNRELLREDPMTNLANLVPELELKENLLEHHDYIGVNKKVYEVLANWYGSDFEICRVLKPDPFQENKSYLELYPKKRQVGKSTQKSYDANNGVLQNDIIKNIIQSNLAQS